MRQRVRIATACEDVKYEFDALPPLRYNELVVWVRKVSVVVVGLVVLSFIIYLVWANWPASGGSSKHQIDGPTPFPCEEFLRQYPNGFCDTVYD